jgi:iron complex transport system substrate-binding protein
MNVRTWVLNNALRAAVTLAAFFAFLAPSPSLAGEALGRIVSLAPNVTEMIFALGLEDKLVGVTTFCDYPPAAREKPKVGGMSNPSLETVVSSRPDIVVMTTDGNPKGFEVRLRKLGIRTHVLTARRISELPDEIRGLGSLLGAEEEAEALAGEIQAALDRYRADGPRGEKVLFVVWPEPLMVVGPGTEVDDVINLLGYENIASGTGINYPRYSVEEVIRQGPDHIIIGMAMGDEVKLSERLRRRIEGTPAFRKGNIRYVSDSLYRLGPRVVEGIRELSEALGGGK